MISNELKWLIDFTLGDGHIAYYPQSKDGRVYRNKVKNAHYKLEHSINQREYLWHKAEILKEIGLTGRETIQDKKLPNGTISTVVGFVTKTDPLITTAYKWCYNKGRKAIDKKLLGVLDARSLAYLFMDDGTANKSNKSTTLYNRESGEKYRYYYTYAEKKIQRYTLYVCNYTLDEIELIQNWILTEFGISTHRTLDGGKWPTIRISSIEEKDKFRELVSPFIVSSMQYKIEGVHSYDEITYTDVRRKRLSEEAPEQSG